MASQEPKMRTAVEKVVAEKGMKEILTPAEKTENDPWSRVIVDVAFEYQRDDRVKAAIDKHSREAAAKK